MDSLRTCYLLHKLFSAFDFSHQLIFAKHQTKEAGNGAQVLGNDIHAEEKERTRRTSYRWWPKQTNDKNNRFKRQKWITIDRSRINQLTLTHRLRW